MGVFKEDKSILNAFIYLNPYYYWFYLMIIFLCYQKSLINLDRTYGSLQNSTFELLDLGGIL